MKKVVLIILVLAICLTIGACGKPAVTEVLLSDTEISMFVDETVTLSYTVVPAEADPKVVRWASSNSGIATVDDKGTVTARGSGTTEITCTIDGIEKSMKISVSPLSGEEGKLLGEWHSYIWVIDGDVSYTDDDVLQFTFYEDYTFVVNFGDGRIFDGTWRTFDEKIAARNWLYFETKLSHTEEELSGTSIVAYAPEFEIDDTEATEMMFLDMEGELKKGDTDNIMGFLRHSEVGQVIFTNKYGTEETKCAHGGCTNNIATTGYTKYCTRHSKKCSQCNKYIDENDSMCKDCVDRWTNIIREASLYDQEHSD